MCGILGFVGTFGSASLDTMARALAHRGPDDRGLHFDEAQGIGLGQTRLAIIDLTATGHQPMADASSRYLVVFNGEIYNYRELRAELEQVGVAFRGRSDTEVMLEWYARLGPAVLDKLNGIFALAIWDRERRELFLARDGLGVKPLYCTEGRRGFAFASELKALLPVLDSRTLDPAALLAALERNAYDHDGPGPTGVDVRLANDEAAAALLAGLVRDGVPVVSMQPLGGALEAAYLQLTEDR